MPAPRDQEDRFAERVLDWFDAHGRKDLPWQGQSGSYPVWISEIMLQQTQVATVIPYFQRFIARFPDIGTLADAPVDAVLRHWSGLGYYARARNLHKTAQRVRDRYAGELPRDAALLEALPGIGRSTAAAILALSFGDRHAILDGNVKRVLARYHACEGWPGDAAVLKRLWEYAERHTPARRIEEYTQAMMDLGATVCTRARPRCGDCPLSADCRALALDDPARYPAPRPRKALPVRVRHMLLLTTPVGEILLQKRPPAGIWGGLWSFPEFDDVDALRAWCYIHLGDQAKPSAYPGMRHTFSHFHMDIIPHRVMTDNPTDFVMEAEQWLWYKTDEKADVGLSAPVLRLLGQLTESDDGAHG